jgi:hypothetical protein
LQAGRVCPRIRKNMSIFNMEDENGEPVLKFGNEERASVWMCLPVGVWVWMGRLVGWLVGRWVGGWVWMGWLVGWLVSGSVGGNIVTTACVKPIK